MRTGYATVTRNVLNRLSKDFECHCLGHNYFGQVLKPPIYFEDNEKIDFYLHGAGRAKYSMDVISQIIKKYDVEIFGGLLDTFMLFESGFLSVDTSPAKTFFYFPSDGGGGLPRGCENVLRKVEKPIAMSKFAQAQVLKAHLIASEYIPHGYDPKIFFPIEDTKKIRKKWMMHGKFVVGTVARNQGRKMLDRTLKAFKIFSKDKPEAMLLMHTDPNDAAQIFSVMNLIKRLNMSNRVVFTGTSFFKAFNYTQMNEVYNLMDVFILTTTGEGFALPIVEAMACGIPQLISDYTSTEELVMQNGQSGEKILLCGEKDDCPWPHTNEVLDGTITGSWDVERGVPSIYDCVKKLNKLYKDPTLRKKYSKAGIEKAKKYYDWDVIMPRWRKVLKGLIE